MWSTWLRRLRQQLFVRGQASRALRRRSRRVRLRLEVLEDRINPGTINVSSNLDPATRTVGTLRYAVNEANTDAANGISDLINVNLDGGTITLSQGVLELTAGSGTVTIAGIGQVAVSGGSASAVFQVDLGAQAALQNLTIEDGNNTGGNGGGIANSGTLTVTDCTLNDNSASNEGGGIYSAGTLTVSGSTFSSNTASSGGALYSEATLTVTGCSFSANSSTSEFGGGGGGAIFSSDEATVQGCTFTGNSTEQYGGDIYNGSFFYLSTSTFTGSNATDSFFGANGGSIGNFGFVEVSDCTIAGCSASTSGGALYNDAAMLVQNSTLSGDTAPTGGGIANLGVLAVVDSTITANTATNGGGVALTNSGASATINDSTLTANTAGTGGAVDNQIAGAALTVSGSTLTGNMAFTSGGAIANAARLTVESSTLEGNSAKTGGGIANSASLTVSAATIDGNTASAAGGGINNASKLTLLSTIVAGNSAPSGPDVNGSATGEGDLVGNGTGMSGLTAGTNLNQVGTAAKHINPKLAALGYYGGPTALQAVLPGSPAINAAGAVTTVATTIAPTDTSITLADAAAIASTSNTYANYVIQIDGEQMLVTNVDLATNTFTVERHYDGTTAAMHTQGTGVFLADDQRGAAGVTAGRTNIGAYAGTLNTMTFAPPTATLSATAVSPSNAAQETPYTFSVVFLGGTYVAAATVQQATVQIQPPTGAPFGATLVSVIPSGQLNGLGDGTTVTADYTITPPGGSWQQAPDGLYTVSLGGPAVSDTSGDVMVRTKDSAGNLLPLSLGGFQDGATQTGPIELVSVTNPVELAIATGTIVTGYGLPGGTVSVIATDGTNTTSAYTTTVGADGTWTIGNVDVSGLADGTITYTGSLPTAQGTQTETISATKDTQGNPASMTYYVAPGLGTLQAAINEAEANSVALNTLILTAGEYDLSSAFAPAGPLTIGQSSMANKTLIIVGQGIGTTIIEPGSTTWQTRVVQIGSSSSVNTMTVALDDLTIRGGNLQAKSGNTPLPAQGGGLYVDGGEVTLSNVAITGNRAQGRTASAADRACGQSRRRRPKRRHCPGRRHLSRQRHAQHRALLDQRQPGDRRHRRQWRCGRQRLRGRFGRSRHVRSHGRLRCAERSRRQRLPGTPWRRRRRGEEGRPGRQRRPGGRCGRRRHLRRHRHPDHE